jgi:hypothetical protein
VNGLRRFVPLLAVGGLLAAAAIAASLATPQITRVPVRPGPASAPSSGYGGPTQVARSAGSLPGHVQHDVILPGWLTTVLSAICIVFVAAVVGAVLYLTLRGRLGNRRPRVEVPVEPPAAPNRRDEVLAAVDAGLSGLDDGDADPRRAVIACWLRLEEAAAAAGTPRRPGDAPADLVLRLLAAHQVSAAVLLPLAEVYRLARYATHTVDAGMRDSARAALRQLRAELSAEPAMGSSK